MEILTATDIDNYQKVVNQKVDESCIKWVRNKLASVARSIKKEKGEFTTEDKDVEKNKILNSEEYQKFREQQFMLHQSKANNYKELRTNFDGLNDLNEFSTDIETMGIQTISLASIDEFKQALISNSSFAKHQVTKKKEYIETWLSGVRKYIDKDFDELNHILFVRGMYSITKDYDDLKLFKLYDMRSNTEIMSDLVPYYKQAKDNIINQWANNESDIVKQHIVSNGLLCQLLSDKHITNNLVTTFESTYTTTQNNKKLFVTRSLGELLLEITNPELSLVDKETRQQIYSTYDGTRPKGDEYYKWNGLQVFDIDLKQWPHISVSNIERLKKRIFDELSKYHWFLWVVKSASGKGIHIYTKSAPPHHIYTKLSDNNRLCHYWFIMNYLIKVNLIYQSLFEIHKATQWFNGCLENDIELTFLDNVVSRITAGIRLTYDPKPLVNHNFVDLHVATSSIDHLETSALIDRPSKINQKLKGIISDLVNVDTANESFKAKSLPKSIQFETFEDYVNLDVVPFQQINYVLRYNVVNTLAHIFGKEGLEIAHYILQSDKCGNTKEINSFYSSALTNQKEPSKFGLDILRKCKVIKNLKILEDVSVEEEVVTEDGTVVKQQKEVDYKTYTDNLFKNGIRFAIEGVCKDDSLGSNVIKLQPNQYLSDLSDMLEDPNKGGFTNEKINILLSSANSGKTHYLLKLARQGKRILLVEPFISVIKNKVENDKDLMLIFDTFYGDKSLNDIEYGVNAITTFDKFSRCNYEKISKMFDYICIDESHLLFTSSYRIEATSSAVRKIKELYYISSNDPFSAKIILMTGTETGDTHFFGKISNTIRVTKQNHDKTIEFLICDDGLDAVTRLSYRTYQLLQDGYKVLIPTNKGEIYSHKLIGMLEHLLKRPLKYGYYKRSNVEQEICRLINEQNTVGDYEVIFCSNYLSVGVDIVDNYKFASLYYGPFSGYEIEQFNARIRRTSIYSVYCIQTETNEGTTNDMLLEEPVLSLKLTNDDIQHFGDDKQIASAKQEFIAQYDPVLHRIVTPGFSWLNGGIKFNKEEYELVMFENKFTESMVHPVKVAKELYKYGYVVKVSNEYEGLKLEEQEELKAIGTSTAKLERIRKHSLLVGTFVDLIDNNTIVTEDGLEFNNVIKYITEHRDMILEDREQEQFMRIEFNIFGMPETIIFKSKEAFETMYSYAKFLSGKYSPQKAKDILYQYVNEEGILKMKHLRRAINLLKLIDKADSNDLSEPVFKILERMYNFIDAFHVNKNYRISYNTYQAELDAWCNQYIDLLGIKIGTTYGYQKIKDNMVEMLNDISTRNTTKNGIRFEYNVLPDTDGALAKYKQTIDMMIESTFKLTHTLKDSNPTKSRHIILEAQSF